MISVRHIILWSLILLPITFKLDLGNGLTIFPQDLILPPLVFIETLRKRPSSQSLGYDLIILSLVIIFISTLISWFSFYELKGLLKVFKYLIYFLSIKVLIDFKFDMDYVRLRMIRVGNLVVLLMLLFVIYSYVTLGKSPSQYLSLLQWDIDYMPTGFSNVGFSLKEFKFARLLTGNHGIYGSYLVILFWLNWMQYKQAKKSRYLLFMALALSNLLFLTTREAMLLLVLTVLIMGVLSRYRVPSVRTFTTICIVISLGFVVLSNFNFTIFNKLQDMFSSVQEGSVDTNVNLRFNTWKLILKSMIENPYSFILGNGYNSIHLQYLLEQVNNQGIRFVGVTENLYLTNLFYGGLGSLFLLLLGFGSLILDLIKYIRTNIHSRLTLSILLGLVVTNLAGTSFYADLVITQFGLVYLFFVRSKKATPCE